MRRLAVALTLVALLALAAPPAAASLECHDHSGAGARAYVCRETVDAADEDRRARWAYAYVPLPGVAGATADGKIEARASEWSTTSCRDREDGRFCYQRNEANVDSSSRTGVDAVDGFFLQLVTYKDSVDGRQGYCTIWVRAPSSTHEVQECRATPEALP